MKGPPYPSMSSSQLIISAMTLFPNQFTVIGTGG